MSNKGLKRVTYYEVGFPTRKIIKYERRTQRGKDAYQLLPLFIVMFGIVVGSFTNGVSTLVNQAYAKEELISPYVETYTSYIPEVIELTTEEIVIEVFGDKSQEALKIMECESRNNPETIGDTHIMVYDKTNNEMVGDSIGLFQVRTGGNGWNRARANGMTADEFRTYLKNPENNIKYAKDIYDNAGSWTPWFNCMNKVLSN